jgi:hypothetical protein
VAHRPGRAVLTPALLALALLAQPEARISPARAELLAHELARVELRHHLPPLLLAAVVLAESGGRSLVLPSRGGCDVGPAQVHVDGCAPARVAALLPPGRSLEAGALVLDRSRRLCAQRPRWRPCRVSRYSLYNAGSSGWWPRVAAIWYRLRAWRPPEV